MSARIDSASVGDPALQLGTGALEAGLGAMPPSGKDVGRLELIVRRGDGGVREAPTKGVLSASAGLEGDSWGREEDRNPEAQITAVEVGVARLIANGQPWALFGDQLFVDLDLSRENLPLGTRVRVGKAVLEVTAKPHNGCKKYRSRFGSDALRFVSNPELRHRNFRGIYFRVVEDGEVAVGDEVRVLRRP